jgi:hypothetical protein
MLQTINQNKMKSKISEKEKDEIKKKLDLV